MQSYKNDNSCPKVHRQPFKDPITKQDVETVVERALGSQAKVINYHVRTFSDEKLGFLGAHRKLVVTIQNKGIIDKEIHAFFLKSVPYDIEVQASVIEDCGAFYKETNFYKKILPELLKSVKDNSWIAECYLVKTDALVFEDLKSRNFSLREKILDVTSLQSALSALAKLHTSSILAEKRLGRELNELYPDLFRESLFVRGHAFERWIVNSTKVAVAVAKSLGLDHTNIPKMVDRIFEMAVASKSKRNVVCHGDVKSYNLMFDDSLPMPNCILVDFQLVRYVPAMTDVLQLIYLNTMSRAFREENEEELLRHYHEVLCETLRDNDKEIELVSFKEILQEYEEFRLFGLVTTTLYSPINLMEGKLCADLTKDSDGFTNLMFGDRVDMTFKMMHDDPLYRSRITEIITELVQRSKKLLAA